RDGVIAGAALDVTDPEPIPKGDPLLSLENCLIVPHVGSASIATRTRMATLAAENIATFLSGRRPPTPINAEAFRVTIPRCPSHPAWCRLRMPKVRNNVFPEQAD